MALFRSSTSLANHFCPLNVGVRFTWESVILMVALSFNWIVIFPSHYFETLFSKMVYWVWLSNLCIDSQVTSKSILCCSLVQRLTLKFKVLASNSITDLFSFYSKFVSQRVTRINNINRFTPAVVGSNLTRNLNGTKQFAMFRSSTSLANYFCPLN